MREQIILAPGVSESEFLRTLAKFGKNTIGLRVVNATELAKIALKRAGVSIKEDFLSSREMPSVIYSFLNEIPYFASASFADAENLAGAINTLREESILYPFEDFVEDWLIEVYERYAKILKEKNLIDSIGIIQKAYLEANRLENASGLKVVKNNDFDADFIYLKEFKCTPLERLMLHHISGGKEVEKSINDFFVNKAEKKQISYIEGYGAINEAEGIISSIYKGHIPLDKCVIACANPSRYSQIFYDLSRKYDIPMTFGSGVPIINSNPAKLLKLISDWDTKGYNGIDALKAVIYSESFSRDELGKALGVENLKRKDIDSICDMAGALRISFNGNINRKRTAEYKKVLTEALERAEKTGNKEIDRLKEKLGTLELVSKLSKEFELGFTAFLEKYVVLRPEPAGRLDKSAINVVTESLNAFLKYADGAPVSEIIPEILEKTVCSEISREGTLHITSIQGALGSLRDNLFVCGLSSQEFPGTPTENYLLLDETLIAIGGAGAPTSVNRINDKKNCLTNLVVTAKNVGVNINLSYSGYDLSELKDQNPSSMLFEIYEEENPASSMKDFKAAFKQANYFESELSSSRLAGDAYAKGFVLDANKLSAEMPKADKTLERAWSPSALDIFFQCPRRFYLTKVLWLPEDEPDDPFMVLSAADIGTLAHAMMEELAAKDMPKADFLKLSEKAFNDFLVGRPPIHKDDADKERKEFLKMMDSAYDQDPHNEVISAEEEYTYDHPSGVKLHGFPDRVEKDKEGNLIIADFKSGRTITHIKNDIDTCFQVVVYAWLLEQAGTDISRCDYRYLRKNRTITCDYNDDMKNKLNEKLVQFKTAVETNDFPRNENETSCKYCKMRDICLWEGDI